MQALYQGKIDNFCAAYAVLNAIKLVRKISVMQSRVLLNEMLYHEAKDPDQWLKILHHETDYQDLAKRMLELWTETFGYKTFCPFNPEEFLAAQAVNTKATPKSSIIKKFITKSPITENREAFKAEVDKDLLWETLKKHTKEHESTVVLRFCRFLPNKVGPIVDHWTTLIKVTDDELYFYDCSLETTGWYIIPREKIYVAPFGALPPQAIANRENMVLTLANEEFAVISPENIHVVEIVKSPFNQV